MGRPERPLDRTNGPIAAFAHDLRALRKLAGNPSYRQLARTALYAPSVLSHAASGHRLPTLQVTLAFVAACGGDRATWERRWRKVAADVGTATDCRDMPAPGRYPPPGYPPPGYPLDDKPAAGLLPAHLQPTNLQPPHLPPTNQPPAGFAPAESGPAGFAPTGSGPAGFAPAGLAPVGLPPVQALVQAPVDTAQSRPFPRATSTFAPPAQLPMGSNTFVGRKHAMAGALRAIGQTGPVRVPLMISGQIGVGKTALALRLADEISAEFPDGQLHAELSACPPGSQSLTYVMRGFLQALGVPPPLVPDDPAQQIGLYRSVLAQRRLFVLLENVRDERQVRPFLGRVMRSQVVVTSRARLLGLDGTHRIELNAFDRHESIALIGRLAGTERVQAEYEATNTIAELCADLPLAVSIIGRKIAARPEWAIAHSVGLLADRDRLMDTLSVGDVNVRDRFASAYRLLSPTAQQAILELAPDGSGWTTAGGLATVTGIPVHLADEVLESLVDAGLLTRANRAGRYRMSTLVSAFVAGGRHDATQVGAQPVDGARTQPAGGSHRPHSGVAEAGHDAAFALARGGQPTP